MPFKSEAQRRLFFAKHRRGEISKKTLDEWQDETRGKKLPERVEKKAAPAPQAGAAAPAGTPAAAAKPAAPAIQQGPSEVMKGMSLKQRFALMQNESTLQGAQMASEKKAAFEAGVVDGMNKCASARDVLWSVLDGVRNIPRRAGRGAFVIGDAISHPVSTVQHYGQRVRNLTRKPSADTLRRLRRVGMSDDEIQHTLKGLQGLAVDDLAAGTLDLAALGGTAAGAKYLHGKMKKRKKTAGDGGGDRSYDITHSSWPAELRKMKKGKGPDAAWRKLLKKAADSSTS